MIQHATIHGRFHRTRQQNSHDFAHSGNPAPGMFYGLVLDGCGSKPSHNEVGAKLLGQFVARYVRQQLAHSAEPTAVLADLFPRCVQFLQQCVDLFPWEDEMEQAQFVAAHLLATVLGFVVTPDTAVFFWQGDGYLVYDGHVITLDSDNRPDYLAYRLLEQRMRSGAEGTQSLAEDTNGFQTLVVARPSLQWLAVATDGWQPDLLPQLGAPRPSLQLARWVNVQARRPGYFEDDGAVAVWWGRGAEEPGSGGEVEYLTR